MADSFTLSIRFPTGNPADIWEASDVTSVRFVGFSKDRWKEAMEVHMPGGKQVGQMRGAYVIRGRDPLVSTVRLYVGHGDLQRRIGSHAKDKEFWSDGVAIVEKSDEWDMGHTGYLETRLIEAAEEAQRCVLTNKQSAGTQLKGAARGDMDRVVKEVVVRLDALGYHEFRTAQAPQSGGSPSSSSARRSAPRAARSTSQRADGPDEEWPSGAELRLDKNGIVAYAQRTGHKRLLVLRGSQASGRSSRGCPDRYVQRRKEIWGDRAQSNSGEPLQFETDQEFGSSSGAATTILGRSANGQMEWRAKDGTQLGQIKD